MQAAPLSPLAQLLWYKLIQIENRERWPEYVTVPNQDLTTLINPCMESHHRMQPRVEYLGIAADEPARFGQLNARKRAPLAEFGIDEGLCGLYCQYNDMLSPTYETSCRDGCWFCHNQGVAQLRHLRKTYPVHWALLMKWDLDSPVTFKADGHTVHDFDRRFQLEDEGLIYPDETFRWSMLDEELNLRWF